MLGTSIHVHKYQDLVIHSISKSVDRLVNHIPSPVLDPVFRGFFHVMKSWTVFIVVGSYYYTISIVARKLSM